MSAPDNPIAPPLMLDVAAVAQLLGVSPRHVWRMSDAGDFPKPVPVGAKLKRWPRSVVLAWVESQSTASPRR